MDLTHTHILTDGKRCDYCDDSAVYGFVYEMGSGGSWDYRACEIHAAIHTCTNPRSSMAFHRAIMATREAEREGNDWRTEMRAVFSPVVIQADRFGRILAMLAAHERATPPLD